MVKKIKYGLAAVLVLLLAAGVYRLFFYSNPEQEVREKLAELCRYTSKRNESGAASTVLKGQILQGLFTDPCTLSFHKGFFSGQYSNVKIANEISRANLLVAESKVEADIIAIEFPEPDVAEVEFTGIFRGVLKSGEKVEDAQDFTAKLIKVDSKWKVNSIQINNIMQK